MKNSLLISLVSAIAVMSQVPCFGQGGSQPLFRNGGFEDGTFAGWHIEYGHYEEGTLQWGWPPHGLHAVIGVGEALPCQDFVVNPYDGGFMARINDDVGDYHATMLWQTGVVSQEHLDQGGTIYVQWGAMLVEPENTHPSNVQPYFRIEVENNGQILDAFEARADRAAANGWIPAGYCGGTLWYKAGVFSVDIRQLSVDDEVTIRLIATDCGWSAHGGFAFLDGIGTEPPDPCEPPADVNNPPIGKITKELWGIGGSSYDTVIMSTGEYYLTETDIKVPGRGFDFEFTRTYRSQSSLTPETFAEEGGGQLGSHWDFNYNMRLKPSGQTYVYFDGAGRKDVYNAPALPTTEGTPPPGYYDTFEELPTGQARITKKDGTAFLYTLQADGFLRLTSIEDRSGNEMLFYYENVGPYGVQLERIVDTFEREILFSYSGNGTIP